MNARPSPLPQAAPQQPSTESGGDTVVSLYNEHDLARSLAPWAQLTRRQRWVSARLIVTDLSVLWCCFVAGRLPAWLLGEATLPQALNVWWADNGQLRLTLFMVIVAGMIAWMGTVQGHYNAHRRKPWWDEVRQIIHVVLCAALIDAMIIYSAQWPLSRLWTGATWALILLGLPLARLAIRRRLLRAGLLTQPYVLIGHPEDVEKAAAALASEPLLGYQPVAVVCPHPGERLVAFKNGPVVAPTPLTPAVREFLARPGAYQLVGVLGIRDNNWLRELSEELMHTRDDLVMVPALGDLPMYGMEASHLFSHDVLFLRARNNLHRPGPQILKRTLDIVGSASLLLLLSPLFAYFAWKISRDGGSPFFGHVRVGQGGKPFKCYKFRSMVVDAQEQLKKLLASDPEARAEWERDFKLRNDPRISKIGRFLRRTSLDELPQLWNVLIGEMSLVGPRPLIHDELARYGKDVTYYLTSRPGMTGLWQVSGRSDTTYVSRIRFDAWYVRNWSLWYDLVIMLRTVRVVLKQEGAV
ncbi:undecaprenyl-phosphate galactose phosphotransferase WbaP [Hydrogenophaga pseudoflava]|uniref:undecaprenyl-phosphate galactose phosphotransferase WbaP n=1 Tax=Hydrogenophaga pseudoflava TaxID=47421 RepID=UPI0027E4AA39|nr:undecaprenyl-phosphate galactose phosphotransferase WbaP [Hydrogenophaga pseudoflava]MDQ7747040.1 undecaprenyl-phosphate galactose phosphotransferase WbaP [Hydrogenophaga pseudoflava]